MKTFFSSTWTIFYIIVCFVTVAGFIPYVILLGRAVMKKRRKMVRLFVLVPLLFYPLFYLASLQMGALSHRWTRAEIYDADFALPAPLFEYSSETERCFLAVYPLPAALRDRFEHVDSGLKDKFPIYPFRRKNFDYVRWQESPPEGDETAVFDWATKKVAEAPMLNTAFEEVREAVKGQGALFAYEKCESPEEDRELRLYVVDLKKSRLYEVVR